MFKAKLAILSSNMITTFHFDKFPQTAKNDKTLSQIWIFYNQSLKNTAVVLKNQKKPTDNLTTARVDLNAITARTAKQQKQQSLFIISLYVYFIQ